MTQVTAFPLTWPNQFPRTKSRESGSFKTSLPAAIKNVQSSLRLFAQDSGKKLEGLTISSNVSLGNERPADPGVAVWFTWDGMQLCIPVDRYTKIEANLQAIHHIIEARRVELRHGSLALVRATFTGYLSLPSPPSDNWWTALGVNESEPHSVVEKAYKLLRSKYHPDRADTGNESQFARVQKAWERYQEVRPE